MIFSKGEIKITTDTVPFVCARTTLPIHTKEERIEISKKPYLNKRNITVTIETDSEEYKLFFPEGYVWDGASIPFGFRWILGGKGNPKFLIPSMVHDKMCECPWLVDYDRELSSKVLYEMLLASKVNKFVAKAMYYSVELYQKTRKKWERK